MARVEIPIVVLHPTTGAYVNNAAIVVQNRPGGSAAVVYDAESGGSPITQPLASDAQGRVTGWMNRGRYQAIITYPDTSTTTIYFDSAPGEDGAITTTWIADSAVTAAKIPDGEITLAKLANNSVDAGRIVDGAVGSSEIADGSVTGNKIGSDAVDSVKLKDDTMTDSNRAVTTNHIRDNAVTTAKILDGNVTDAKLAQAPSAGAYKTISEVHGGLSSGSFTAAVGLDGYPFQYNQANYAMPKFFYHDPAHYAVAGRTLRYRLAGGVLTNNTDPGAGNIVLMLTPIVGVTGAPDRMNVTPGTASAQVTLVANPAASSQYFLAGSDFAPPSAGLYALGFIAVVATDAMVALYGRLEYHHV